MKKIILSSLVVATVLFTGCGNSSSSNKTNTNGGSTPETNSSEFPAEVKTALSSPTSTLTQELTNTLSYMGNEERLAYDVYNKLSATWGTKQFTNIASNSEIKHIGAVQQLIQKYKLDNQAEFTNIDMNELGYLNTNISEMNAGTYDIAKIQVLYDDLIAQGSVSEIEALKVGCTVEVVDVNDLDAYMSLAEASNASDVLAVFDYLRKGSYNHYWAFDKGLKNKGVAEGCCTWKGEDGSLNLCHTEYPQK